MLVGKVLEEKLARTRCVLQSTAVCLPLTLTLTPTGIVIKNSLILKKQEYFSQYCLAMQVCVWLNVLHLHVSANVVANECFLFIFPFVWGM